MKDTDTVIDCLPDSTCPCCGKSDIFVHNNPFYRHQVHEIPKPTVNISEYRLFSGQCRHCHEVTIHPQVTIHPRAIDDALR
ncbi:IS66 family transposase zinc-finger binding domain-containing protein [Vibrio sp. 1404]|uniref:IS66 family transposase zinc-finger binding domain-containing protein n=1 Tax=Vibrio sp. 1404 TaxID=3074556 RepID=UPI0021F065D2|nr:IS66 family transposase zinc-finger binding domain-containing protein [Vibrio sp. 1404]